MSENLKAFLDFAESLGAVALTAGAVWAIWTQDLPRGWFAKGSIYAGVMTSGICALIAFGFWLMR